MLTKGKLVSVKGFDLKINHFFIVGILILSFTISFLLRSQAADYGFELNEFDPFFNFRATEYLVENGITAYFQWNDDLSWYPIGRDVSATSQVMLHLTAGSLYWIFGGGMDLYDFTIMFPVVFGSLSAIVFFALVRVLAGTTAGLIAAMLYSISLPILIRGPIGWFKSEPLGLFFSLLTVYLLISGINSQDKKIVILKLIGAGIFTSFSISAWGGNQFFIIPLGLFFITLPFLRTDHKFIIGAIPLYTITTLLFSLGFERVSSNFVFGLGGISLVVPTLFLVIFLFIQIKTKKNKTRNGLLILVLIIVISSSIVIINLDSQNLSLPSYRYLNALNPFLTTTDPLVDSISEHATTTISQSFTFHSILMIFAGIGIWLTLKNVQNQKSTFIKNDMLSFSLIIGITGVYVSSTFVRLEIFASIAVIILASFGLTLLYQEFFQNNSKTKKYVNKSIKFSFILGVLALLVIPLVYPNGGELFVITKTPPTILNGGSVFNVSTSDWLDSLEWIKNNTPKDSVIAAWWDYGYWISTMGERATLADNSTIHTDVIQNIAKILLDKPGDSLNSLNDLQADYILIFVAGQKLGVDSPESLYLLQGGGDESKKQWFMRIAQKDLSKYLFYDGISATPEFWENTLLGKLIPFTPISYVDFNTNQNFLFYQPGLEPVYVKDIKYPPNGNTPFRLVYASPSFTDEKTGPMIGVFIYEINKKYVSVS